VVFSNSDDTWAQLEAASKQEVSSWPCNLQIVCGCVPHYSFFQGWGFSTKSMCTGLIFTPSGAMLEKEAGCRGAP
jgi:hypothetical protein